jgi:hypothetical protein
MGRLTCGPRAEELARLNLCRSCGSDFASVSAFDRHRTGVHAYTHEQGLQLDPPVENGRRCLDEAEMRGAGMELDPRGRWRIAADAERIREAFSALRMTPERPGEDSDELEAA